MNTEITDFPNKGDDKKISLRNSNYDQFDYSFAINLRDNHPSIWSMGGNIRGNSAFTNWGKARDGSESEGVLDWIKERESWAARHFRNKNIEGVVAQIKWGAVGSRGESYMKNIVREEIEKNKDKSGAHSMELKKLVVPFAIKQTGEDEDFYTFEGYASTFGNVDLGQDRVIPGAFKACIAEYRRTGKMLPVLWQHDMTMPLGVYVEMEEDSKGLFVKGKLPKGDDFVRGRVIPQMKAGSVSAMSIGYVAKQWEIDGEVRNLKEIMLYETSLVTMPMNPMAQITGMKAAVPFQDLPLADASRSWDSTAAMGRFRSFLGSEDEPSERYKRAFLWYDAENEEDFGAYKLPIADVVDGRLVAVPRAIFAAAAAIQGARGGVDITDADADTVKAHINRYYSKMDRESPFDGKGLVLHSEMLDVLTKGDLDSVLRNGVRVTRTAAKKLTSCLDFESLRDAGAKSPRDANRVEVSAETEEKLENLLKKMRS